MAVNKPLKFLMCTECGWEVPNHTNKKEVFLYCKMCKRKNVFEEDSDDYHRATKKRKR